MQVHELNQVYPMFDRLRYKLNVKPGDVVPIEFNYEGGKFDIHCFAAGCQCQNFELEQLENNAARLHGKITVEKADILARSLAKGMTAVHLNRNVSIMFEKDQPWFEIKPNGQRTNNGKKQSITLSIELIVDLEEYLEEEKEAKRLAEAGIVKT